MNWIKEKIGSVVTSYLEGVQSEFVTFCMNSTHQILVIFMMAIVGYLFYNCVYFMFFGKEQIMKKILFSYFILLLTKIFDALIIFQNDLQVTLYNTIWGVLSPYMYSIAKGALALNIFYNGIKLILKRKGKISEDESNLYRHAWCAFIGFVLVKLIPVIQHGIDSTVIDIVNQLPK